MKLQISVTAFNQVSRIKKTIDVAVTEVLCEYPFVKIDKPIQNSILVPRVIFSFVEFRLYTSIRINCKITSLTDISWFAYEMIENPASPDDQTETPENSATSDFLPDLLSDFSTLGYSYKEVHGLSYTSKSEDIAFKARFLKIGIHLICVNVAMVGVEKLHSTDCVYVDISLPPLVAGFRNGVARSAQHGETIEINVLTSSYDPNVATLAEVRRPSYNYSATNLIFRFSCPFVVKGDTVDFADDEEKKLMFGGNSGTVNKFVLCLKHDMRD